MAPLGRVSWEVHQETVFNHPHFFKEHEHSQPVPKRVQYEQTSAQLQVRLYNHTQFCMLNPMANLVVEQYYGKKSLRFAVRTVDVLFLINNEVWHFQLILVAKIQ